MFSNAKINILAALTLIFSLASSCTSESCDEPIPELTYESFLWLEEYKGQLTYYMQDCDGDIGLAEGDTTGVHAPGEEYEYNFKVEIFTKHNGEWIKEESGGKGFSYRIPPLSQNGKDPILTGDIVVDMTILPLSSDTFKFVAFMTDQAFNTSLGAESEEFVRDWN